VSATVGLVLAAIGILQRSPADTSALSEDVVARVNGVAITRSNFERVVAGLASEMRGSVDDAKRRHILGRMIDEELLVQRGLELGLASADQRIRASLTQAMVESVVGEVQSERPEAKVLQAFYEENSDFFAVPGRLRVRQVFFRVRSDAGPDSGENRAADARRRLQAGEPFEEVLQALGDRPIAPLPDAMLPATKLRDYLGQTAARTALELEIGETSEPVHSATGIHLLQVVERQPTRVPGFTEIAPQVEGEWRRRAGEAALRAYLDDLKEHAELSIAESL
jgi:parvulin-like peptidyl-prolyl isomerase